VVLFQFPESSSNDQLPQPLSAISRELGSYKTPYDCGWSSRPRTENAGLPVKAATSVVVHYQAQHAEARYDHDWPNQNHPFLMVERIAG